MAREILEPLIEYKGYLKNEFRERAEAYVFDLVEKSNLDTEANEKTINRLKEAKSDNSKYKAKYNKYRRLVNFMRFILFFSVFIAAIFILKFNEYEMYIPILVIIACVSSITGAIILNVKVLKPKRDDFCLLADKSDSEINRLEKKAAKQVEEFNLSLEYNIPINIINSLDLVIHIDDGFPVERYAYMHEHYNISCNSEIMTSIVSVYTGLVANNPFIWYRTVNLEMLSKRYKGSLVVTWEETYYDDDGNECVRDISETLYAYVEAEVPHYFTETFMKYMNSQCGNLSYTRSPQGISGKDEKAIRRKVERGERKLKKLERAALGDGNNFVGMNNTEFDVLFHAFDRDNEIEFRMLYSPLAQKNMLSLLKDDCYFGDDFYVTKEKHITTIESEHGHNANIYCSPDQYKTIDYKETCKKVIDYSCYFFENLFFELAPILSVPLFQEYNENEFEFDKYKYSTFNPFEVESLLNIIDSKVMAHQDTTTEIIVKCKKIEKINKYLDYADITTYSFEAVKRVEEVPVQADDGNYYDVPVEWIEYVPLEKQTKFALINAKIPNLKMYDVLDDTLIAILDLFSSLDDLYYLNGVICILLNDFLSFDMQKYHLERFVNMLKEKGGITL